MILENPLIAIVLLCVGKYSTHSKWDNVDSAEKDYLLAIEAFNRKRGYVIFYMHDTNKPRLIKNKLPEKGKIRKDFKLEWNSEDIDNFNHKRVSKVLNNKKSNYDGLIYIISGHGDDDDSLIDSFGEEYPLAFIFDAFNNKDCKALRNKPKIFIVDTDRGDDEIIDTIIIVTIIFII